MRIVIGLLGILLLLIGATLKGMIDAQNSVCRNHEGGDE